MNLSHAYGAPPPREDAIRLLHRALDLGVTHFDTAALYGFGRNEELVGEALRDHRDRIFLASKCGMTGVDGKRVIDGRPETLRRTCHEALKRLQTNRIDLYYLHRWDKSVPIEESVGALADLVRAGDIRAIGLSEVSAATVRRAHAVHPVAAVQSEYSLFTRNAEYGVLDICREIGAAYVAFSPLARGLLAEGIPGAFVEGDIRRNMPRFIAPFRDANLALATRFAALARENGAAPAALALAWLLYRAPHIVPIPGTTSIRHLEEDVSGADVNISPELAARMDALINTKSVQGDRYPAMAQAEIDTETVSAHAVLN